jgi:serine/threonine-protein kinase
MPIASVANLVGELRGLGLLTEEQLHALPRIASSGDVKTVAADLIRRGWLTAYQINQLVQGRGRDLFLGPYLFLERLGEGGMGQVFKALHRQIGRVDAVKVIRKDRLNNPATLRRFQREVAATTRLDHPNIVRAFEYGQADERWYFAMEYVAGTDLGRRVLAHGPLSLLDACGYIRQAALGLQHAHERGLVHRDIKPHNLIVAPAPDNQGPGLLKVLDLGLALITYADEDDSLSSLTQHGFVMGTADYMAPEQAQNAHLVDSRADLYSLGCTLYYLLSGQVPFPGGTLLEKLMKQRLDEPTRLEELRPDVPASIAALVRRLMAKSLEERPRAAELVGFLSSECTALQSRPQVKLPPTVLMVPGGKAWPGGPARPRATGRQRVARGRAPGKVEAPTEPPPAPYPQRRRPLRKLLLGLGPLAVLVLIVVMSVSMRPPEDGPPRTMGQARRPVPPEAAQAWEALQRLQGEELRAALLQYRARYPESMERATATAWIARLPSPLDDIEPGPRLANLFFKPKGLVLALKPPPGENNEPVRCVVFRPDGRELAAAQGKTISIWDVLTEKVTDDKLLFSSGEVSRLAWSPDGKLLAAGGANGAVQVWALPEKTARTLSTDKQEITALAFSPDSRSLATANNGGTVLVWDLAPTVHQHAMPGLGASRVLCAAWSPDGRALVAGDSDNTLRAWVPRTGTLLLSDKGRQVWQFVAAFTPDGESLLCGGCGDGALCVMRWSAQGPREDHVLPSEGGPVVAISPTPDGRGVFTAVGNGRLLLRDLKTGDVRGTWDVNEAQDDFSAASDGRHIAVPMKNGSIYVLRVAQRP